MAVADYHGCQLHEAASKFLGQSHHQAKYSAAVFSSAVVDCVQENAFVASEADEEISAGNVADGFSGLGANATGAQGRAEGHGGARDACAPIGRTAKGELVYSMKCDNLPVPPPVQAEAREAPVAAPPPEPEVQRGGIFGWSYDRRPKSE